MSFDGRSRPNVSMPVAFWSLFASSICEVMPLAPEAVARRVKADLVPISASTKWSISCLVCRALTVTHNRGPAINQTGDTHMPYDSIK